MRLVGCDLNLWQSHCAVWTVVGAGGGCWQGGKQPLPRCLASSLCAVGTVGVGHCIGQVRGSDRGDRITE